MSGSLPSSCCEGDGPSSEIFVLKIRLHTSKRHVSKDAMVRTTTTTAAGTAVQVLAFEYLSIEYHRISCRIWVAGLNKIPKTTQTSLNISLFKYTHLPWHTLQHQQSCAFNFILPSFPLPNCFAAGVSCHTSLSGSWVLKGSKSRHAGVLALEFLIIQGFPSFVCRQGNFEEKDEKSRTNPKHTLSKKVCCPLYLRFGGSKSYSAEGF